MPDLFALLPSLQRVSHPLVESQRITAVGVSGILYHASAFVFEITRPRYWGRNAAGDAIVGVGGIGGRIIPGEGALECLRREVSEETGAEFRLDPSARTALVHDGQMVTWFNLSPDGGAAAPYIVNLLPSQLERPDRPDHVAIITYRGMLQQDPRRADLFGLLCVQRPALSRFFGQAEWLLEDALKLPGLTFDFESQPPPDSVLRPTLTARAFGVVWGQGADSASTG